MNLLLVKLIFVVFFVSSSAFSKNIIDALKTDIQSIALTDCEPSNVLPVVQNEQNIPTAIEKPPFNMAVAPLTTTVQPTIGNFIPMPRVIGHTFHFFKTILKPQVYRQIVTVPYIQKYARYFQVPVIETYHYQQEVPF